jgi:hypothetical protein
MDQLRFIHRYYDQSVPPAVAAIGPVAASAPSRPRRRVRDLPPVPGSELPTIVGGGPETVEVIGDDPAEVEQPTLIEPEVVEEFPETESD